MTIKILIVDDHAKIRKMLRRHLQLQQDFTVVGEAADGLDGVASAVALQPDVVLMDVSMPVMDGIEATRLIQEQLPQVKILMLSLYNSNDNRLRAMDCGAWGYILKELAAGEVVAAIRTVMRGGQYFGADILGKRPGVMV